MRERDLKLKSDGDAFKSIFDDVLKTRVIGDVGRGIGACLGARGGLKGAVGAGVARWHEDLAEREHDTAVARVEELERLSAELQAVHGYRSATAAAAAEQAAAEEMADARRQAAERKQTAAAARGEAEQLGASAAEARQRLLAIEADAAAADDLSASLAPLQGELDRREQDTRRRAELLSQLEERGAPDLPSLRGLLQRWRVVQAAGSLRVEVERAPAGSRFNGGDPVGGVYDAPLSIETPDLTVRVVGEEALAGGRGAIPGRAAVAAEVAAIGGVQRLQQALALPEELQQLERTTAAQQEDTDLERRVEGLRARLAAARAAGARHEAASDEWRRSAAAAETARAAQIDAERAEVRAEQVLVTAGERVAELGDASEAAQRAAQAYDQLPHGTVRRFASIGDQELADELARCAEQLEDARRQAAEIDLRVSRLQGRTEASPDEAALRADVGRLERVQARAVAWERRLTVARALIDGLVTQMDSQHLSQLQLRMSELFAALTGHEYQRFRIESHSLFRTDLLATLRARHRNLREHAYVDLSDGTKVQAALALRFALVEHAVASSSDQERFFLLCDEPFPYFDAAREAQGREMLRGLLDQGWQVIVVSCKVAPGEAGR